MRNSKTGKSVFKDSEGNVVITKEITKTQLANFAGCETFHVTLAITEGVLKPYKTLKGTYIFTKSMVEPLKAFYSTKKLRNTKKKVRNEVH
jgi:hypothetical protein